MGIQFAVIRYYLLVWVLCVSYHIQHEVEIEEKIIDEKHVKLELDNLEASISTKESLKFVSFDDSDKMK